MRKVGVLPILVFEAFFVLSVVAAIFLTRFLLSPFRLGDFRGVVFVILFVILFYLVAILFYRIFLHRYPIKEGVIEEGSKDEFAYHVYLMFYLILFYSLTRSKALSVVIMRGVYILLGARLGVNTYSSGTILDPPLTFIGSNTLIGQDCVLYSHAIEGRNLSHAAIRVGDNVTIGANSVIMSGVTIGDNAIVAAGAVVRKETDIGAGEIWGGVPAKKIGMVNLLRAA